MESTSSETLKSDADQLVAPIKHNIDDRNKILSLIALRCKEEMENNCLLKPLEDYVERVAHYTGLSKHVINKVISKDLKDFNHKDKCFELSDRINLFKYIATMYSSKKFPKYKNLFHWYKTINAAISFIEFQYMMNGLGFEYHKTEYGKEIIIEDPAFTYERYLYLKKLYNFRSECAPIYYIDERYFDSTNILSKPLTSDIDISSASCERYVFFHAISKQGFLNGLFCSPATKQDFLKWISHILIPLLPGPSVIIMDKNHLHGSLINTITKYHSKTDMLQYLRQRNIPCNEYLHKAELYELINKCSIKHTCYDVDEILKAHGHHVLRLPTNFHDLSLTHFLWKHFVDSEQILILKADLAQLKITLLNMLNQYPQQLWDEFHENLLKIEKEIFKIDSKAYISLETNYKIRLQ